MTAHDAGMTAASSGFLQLLVVALAMTSGPRADAQSKVVAYVPNWIGLNSFSETIDYPKITHINLAFENPVNASGDLSFNNQNNAVIAKAHASKVKVLVSIWRWLSVGRQGNAKPVFRSAR